MLASQAFPFIPDSIPAKSKDVYQNSDRKTPLSKETFSSWRLIDTPSTATSEPVVIPMRSNSQIPGSEPHKESRNDARRRSQKLSDSTRALLADTSIPPPRFNKNTGRRKSHEQRLTVDAILQHTRVSEKELSSALKQSSSYMDILLSPPDEIAEDEATASDAGHESIFSARTMSSESMPSLDEASTGDASPSSRSSLATLSYRGRKSIPTRSWLSLASIAAGESAVDHPLSSLELDLEDNLTFRTSENTSIAESCSDTSEVLVIPRRGFKSNITASLRAIKLAARSSARSLASLTAPPVMPDNFLHRSIISEPKMPFTDDRMPPVLLDIPTPELRRYLNPITNAPIQAHVPSSKTQMNGKVAITASMQLRTYRLNRTSPSQNHSVISIRTKPTPEPDNLFPVVPERGYRDNSDFERRLCFDKLMRQAGKLSETAPSKAYFSYPPRKQSRLPYRIGADGVPERWVGITCTQANTSQVSPRRSR